MTTVSEPPHSESEVPEHEHPSGGPGTDTTPEGTTAADYDPPQAGTLTNLLCGIAVAALGIFGLLQAFSLGVGAATAPAAGTWPLILSVLMTVLGVGIMLAAPRLHDAEKLTRNALGVAVGAASLLIAVELMPHMGFEIPALLMMVFWMSVLARERYIVSIPVAAVTVIAFYLIFVTGLSVPIPRLF